MKKLLLKTVLKIFGRNYVFRNLTNYNYNRKTQRLE